MLSIMRIVIFDPVGIVHAVLAALDDVGCVTRSFPGTSLGGVWVADELPDLVVEEIGDLSSPN
jgi:hypothetical protein